MILFLDSSALVKQYVDESGSQAVRAWFDTHTIIVSPLTFAEVMCALARRWRENLLSEQEFNRLTDAFQQDWPTLLHVPVDDAVVSLVAWASRRWALKGADTLQLASAVSLVDPSIDVGFASADVRLTKAAREAGLIVLES